MLAQAFWYLHTASEKKRIRDCYNTLSWNRTLLTLWLFKNKKTSFFFLYSVFKILKPVSRLKFSRFDRDNRYIRTENKGIVPEWIKYHILYYAGTCGVF